MRTLQTLLYWQLRLELAEKFGLEEEAEEVKNVIRVLEGKDTEYEYD